MYSKTQIYNLALNALGVSAPIQNANEQDTRAILLSNQYELARDTVLKDFDWNFAMAFKNLTLTGNKSENPNYLHEFDCPNDCISARAILDETGREREFLPSSNSSGQKVILTNTNPCRLRYTRLVDQETFFSPEFVIVLAYLLASLTSEVITGSSSKGEKALKKYQIFLNKAKVSNAQEGIIKDEDNSTYIDSRD